ncbi:MAG: ABC transporter permease [Spirochaetia bacterium]|nr:ABC transporter permease [Spirochaetia bacterium]MCF7946730.1 ABC transporter permease [Spirochaetia bacterium]
MTYWADVWRRFKQNKLSLFGAAVIFLLIFTAVFGPMMTDQSYSDQDRDLSLIPPLLDLYKLDDNQYLFVSSSMDFFLTTRGGEIIETIEPNRDDLVNKEKSFTLRGQEYTFNYSRKPWRIVKENNDELFISRKNVWNKTNPLGTDTLGRDLWIRIMYGARISLIVGLVASLVNLTIGILYGGISAYAGGVIDNIMMRFVDILRSIPRLLYVILLMVVFGSGLKTVVITIGLVYWLGMARIVRGQILSLKNQEFVMAAKVMGAKSNRILLRHLIPNAMGPIIVTVAMNIPAAIFTEAFLSFVGLGVSAPQASWGTLANNALGGLMTYPYLLFFPALAISLTVLAFNFVGDGLRDSIDPRLRK